jgi:colanic acid biosynthesis glycosyl transferase WcaI
LRILLCGINYAPDLVGIAKFNTELCEALAAYGHEVRVVTAPSYYPAWKASPTSQRFWSYHSECRNGVLIRRAPIYVPAKPTGLKRLLHHGSFALSSALPVAVEARRWRPQLMFSVAPSLVSSAVIATTARRIQSASWLHLQDFEIDAAFGLGLLKSDSLKSSMLKVERSILRSFDRVSSVSSRMLRRLGQKGVAPERLREFRNWVDTTAIKPGPRLTKFRNKLGLADNDVVALYSGSISKKQGLELIVAAAKELEQKCPMLKFVVCGEGPELLVLQSAAIALTNVHFLPIQSEDSFPELLNTADIHLLPQREEAADLVLPSKLGGMLASGRPTIAMATAGTGIADEVREAGLLVSPGNVTGLTEALCALVENSVLRASLGANARSSAVRRWDKLTILRDLERELITFAGPHREPSEVNHESFRTSSNKRGIAARFPR